MAAPTSYPSYAYNSTQLSTVIVANVTQFNALPAPGVWTTTPYAGVSGIPADPGLTDTDVRLQQILVESRLGNNLLAMLGSFTDDLLTWRQDIVANDSGLTT
jgi:hypothetical protein